MLLIRKPTAEFARMNETHSEPAEPPMATFAVASRKRGTSNASRQKLRPSNRRVHTYGVKLGWTLLVVLGYSVLMAQASPETSELHDNMASLLVTAEDPRSQLHAWITTIISVLVICTGLGYGAMVSTYEKKRTAFRRQDVLGLMTLMASLCWWVVTTTVNSPSDGKSGSISVWLALFAVSFARHRHGLRNQNAYLFTSLLGGLVAATLVAAVVMLASEDKSLTKPPSMSDFIGLILTVGPTVATVWCWVITFVFESMEGQGGNDLATATHGEVELTDRSGLSNNTQS